MLITCHKDELKITIKEKIKDAMKEWFNTEILFRSVIRSN